MHTVRYGARRPRRAAAFAACAAAATLALCAQGQELPSADEVLRSVRDQMPRRPVVVTGRLDVHAAGGDAARVLRVELRLNYGAQPPSAQFTIMDALGGELEQLTVERPAGGPPRYTYAAGTPLAKAPLPDLLAPIQASDITWADLGLSFLWWEGGRTTGRDLIRGQACFVIDLPAPEGTPGNTRRLRLWIDESFRVLLQAEAFDAAGTLVRRLNVRSFQKIGEQWVLKDMTVQSFPSRRRTALRITDVKAAGPAAP